jgi:hypothetical protein
MPLQFHIIRITLGILAVAFAFQFARVLMRIYLRGLPANRAVSWGLRTAASLAGALWVRQTDLTAILILIHFVIALGVGAYLELRPKQEEDLTQKMFPKS